MVRVPSLVWISSTNDKNIKDCISFGSRSSGAGVVRAIQWDWEEVSMWVKLFLLSRSIIQDLIRLRIKRDLSRSLYWKSSAWLPTAYISYKAIPYIWGVPECFSQGTFTFKGKKKDDSNGLSIFQGTTRICSSRHAFSHVTGQFTRKLAGRATWEDCLQILRILRLRNRIHRNITLLADGKGALLRKHCESKGEKENMEKPWSCVSISISDSPTVPRGDLIAPHTLVWVSLHSPIKCQRALDLLELEACPGWSWPCCLPACMFGSLERVLPIHELAFSSLSPWK